MSSYFSIDESNKKEAIPYKKLDLGDVDKFISDKTKIPKSELFHIFSSKISIPEEHQKESLSNKKISHNISFENSPSQTDRNSNCKKVNKKASETNNDRDKLVANIIGDPFLKSTTLEGHAPIEMMYHFRNWLFANINSLYDTQNTTDINKLQKFILQLDRGISIQEQLPDKNPTLKEVVLAAQLMQDTLLKITSEKDDGILLASGYNVNESGGHSIFFLITRNNDSQKTFRLEVFNTGSGIGFHHSQSSALPDASERNPKMQTLYSSQLVIDKIAEERMTSMAFWRACIEMNCFTKIPEQDSKELRENKKNDATNYSEMEFYDILLSFLNGEIESCTTYNTFVIPQHSGTCSWNGLFRGAVKSVVSESCFDRLEYQIEFDAFDEICDAYKDPVALAKKGTVLEFLVKSHKILSRKLYQFHIKRVISLDEYESANANFEKIDRHLCKAAEIYESERAKNAPTVLFQSVKPSHSGDWPKEMVQLKELNSKNVVKPHLTSLYFDPNWKPTLNTITVDLNNFCVLCEKKMPAEPRATAYFICELLMRLPVPKSDNDPFWHVLVEANLLPCMESIAKLSEIFVQSCFASNADSFSEKRVECIIALHKGLAIQHKLVLRCKELQTFEINNWRISPEYFQTCFTSYVERGKGRAQIFDKRINEQFMQVFDYFSKTFNDREEFFSCYKYSQGISAYNHNVIHNEQSFAYLYFVNNREEFFKTIGKSLLGKTLSDQEGATYSLIDLSGEFLPKTYCMLKRQAFLAHFFMSGHEFKLTLEDGKNETTNFVKISTSSRNGIEGPHKYGGNINFTTVNDYLNKSLEPIGDLSYGEVQNNSKRIDIKNLHEDEIYELVSLRSAIFAEGTIKPNELSLVKAVDYFINKIHKLADHDCQCFFNDIIFYRNNLKDALQNSPTFPQYFLSFIQKGFLEFDERNNIPAAVYMIFLCQTLKDYLRTNEVTAGKLILEQLEKDFNTENLLKILLKRCKTLVQKMVVYRQLVAEYALQWPLNEKELPVKIPEIISALTFMEAASVPPEHKCGHLAYVVDRFKRTIQPKLEEIFKNTNLCTEIVKAASQTLQISQGIDWKQIQWKILSPQCIGSINGNDVCYFNFQDFIFTVNNGNRVFLPNSITSHDDFRTNFPNKAQILASTNGFGFYEFEDSDGSVRLQCVSDKEITIQRQFKKSRGGLWYQYQSKNPFLPSIECTILSNQKTFWTSCKEMQETLLLNKGTTTITHRLIKSKSDPTKFDIIDEKNPHLIILRDVDVNSLFSIENRPSVLILVNSKSWEPERIEMPKLKLHFDFKSLKAFCREITGFYIASSQYVKGLGKFDNFLVLKNEAGMAKVVIPQRYLLNFTKGGIHTHPVLSAISTNTNSKYPPYFEYVVNKDGSLHALNDNGMLHLAYIFMGLRKYEETQKLIRQCAAKLKRFKSNDTDYLDLFEKLESDIKDNHPKSLSVYLSLVSLYIRSSQLHGTKNTSLIGKKLDIEKTYFKYVQRQEFMSDTLLTFDEELSIVKYLKRNYEKDDFLKARLAALQKAAIGSFSYEPQTSIQNFTSNEYAVENMEYYVAEVYKRQNDDAWKYNGQVSFNPSSLITRNLKNENFNVKEAFNLAKSIPKQFSRDAAFMFELAVAFRKDKYVSAFLAAVTLEPSSFKSFEETTKFLTKDKMLLRTEEDEKNAKEFKTFIQLAVKIYNDFRKQKSSKSIPHLAAQYFIKKDSDRKIVRSEPIPLQKNILAITQLPTVSNATCEKLFNPAPSDDQFQKHASELLQILQKEGFEKSEADTKVKKADLSTTLKQELFVDISHHRNHTSERKYRLENIAYKQLLETTLLKEQQNLNKKREDFVKVSNEFLDMILKKANKIPKSYELIENDARVLRENYVSDLLCGNKKPFTIEELSLSILRNERGDFYYRNPFLSVQDIQKLRSDLIAYLLRISDEQKLLRREEAIKSMLEYLKQQSSNVNLKTDLAFQELSDKLVEELLKMRVDNTEDLALLIFETHMGIILRPEQIASLSKLKNASHIIMQMIMGSGKSKVLLPLLALSVADGDTLPLIMIPHPLFEMMAKELRQSFGGAFNGIIQTRSFHRNTVFTVNMLNDFWDQLSEIRAHKQCLMMTNKSIACLLLKFKETCILYSKNPKDLDLRQKAMLLQKILRLFKEKGKVIIDEADTILNARLETNFTLDKVEEIDPALCKLVRAIYDQIRTKEMIQIFGSDPLEAYSLLTDEYHTKVKPLLAEKMLSVEPIAAFIKSLNPDLVQIRKYITDFGDEATDKYISSLKDKSKPFTDLLALLKEELNTLLPLTLSKRYCVDYGPSKRPNRINRTLRTIAIPYNGNDSPIENSEFRSTDIIMNYTLQSCWKTGIFGSDIHTFVKRLQDKALQEKAIKGLKSYLQTESYQTFKDLCGKEYQDFSFLDVTLADCQKIADSLNSSRKIDSTRFFDFVMNHILSQIRIYPQQLTSTAIDLTGLFKSSIGFSGTPWNFDTYAEKLRKTTEKSKGTDGKTAILLHAKVAQQGIRTFKKPVTYPDFLEELIRDKDDALIDTGAIFNGQPHEKVAADILSLLQKRSSKKSGVVFFQKNNAVVLELIKVDNKVVGTKTIPLSQTTLKLEELFTYFDQAHTIGADIKLPLTACATLTIGKDEKVRDLFQGAWRLRGLDKQQSVSIMVMPEAEKRMQVTFKTKGEFSFIQLLQFLLKNQERELIEHLKLSTIQKVDFVSRQEVLNVLLDLDFGKVESAKLITELYDMLVTTQSNNPFEMYGKRDIETDKQIVLKSVVDSLEKKLRKIPKESALFKGNQESFISVLRKRVHEEWGDSTDLLPQKLSAHFVTAQNSDGLAQREQEKEQQSLSEKELQRIMHTQIFVNETQGFMADAWWKVKENPPPLFLEKLFNPTENRVWELHDLFSRWVPSLKFAPLAKGLKTSLNRVPPKKYSSLDVWSIHHKTQLPANYFLLIYHNTSKKLTLSFIDIEDLNFFWVALTLDQKKRYPNCEKREVSLCMTNSNLDVLHHDSTFELSHVNPFYKAMQEQAPALMVQAKLLLGEVLFTETEQPHLQALIKTHGSELICEYLQKQIFERDKKRMHQFIGSPLFKLLGGKFPYPI